MDEQHLNNQIAGTVSELVYRNEENGYTILRLTTQERGAVTMVGCMPGISPGEGVSAEGRWIHHATYGPQFKAEVIRREMPSGAKAMFDYLASGAVKGVGLATARRLVDEFGADTFRILEEEPEKLAGFKGITRKRALSIGEAFRRQMGMRRLLTFLTEHALPAQLAMPLYRRFGDVALEALKDNPYMLVDSELGVAFSAADGLALSIGLQGSDPQRLEAALLFELSHNTGNGHTFLPRRKLLDATAQLIDVGSDCLEVSLDALESRGAIVTEDIAGETACYLADLHEAETYVAFRLAEMSAAELLPPKQLDRLMSQIEREQGISYADSQRDAVRIAASRQVMLLSGGPGTGKTTSLRGVLRLFETLGLETALAAPTGRAAKRLGEACGSEGYTIHRLLETRFDSATGQLVFFHDADNPLRADAVIVDETSMVDIMLMRALLTALRGDCRLILVGDPDQLPSVGPGSVLSDLLRCGTIPSVRLTEIFRQAQESAIVMNAHAVNQGQLPRLRNEGGDFFFLRRRDGLSTVETITELCKTRLPQNMGIPADQIQVLSPTRRRGTGTAALNSALQAALNPPSEEKEERRFGDYTFRTGDRVMQVKNNYDVLWRMDGDLQNGMGIFNGDIGKITEVDLKNGTLTVDFEGRVVDYSPEMLGELEPAFAVTVHKAQGSEYRAVILAAFDGAPSLLTRGVLYTAITRARELFIVVGDEAVISQMIRNNRQQRRYSGLRARLSELE
ncbi:MAG: RecD-like helicase YrrC [Oscillospiraceae bacterium]|nr:RecD-like helicase YrrC [Oscillospiraceae bacterium]